MVDRWLSLPVYIAVHYLRPGSTAKITARKAERRRGQPIGLAGQYASLDEMLTGTENLVLIARASRRCHLVRGRRCRRPGRW